jgi:RNase H-like domain found in reverse transcriptase
LYFSYSFIAAIVRNEIKKYYSGSVILEDLLTRILQLITAPITDCLQKGVRIERNAQTLQAFERLEEIMTSSPVLAMFDLSAHHVVEADASGVACGAVWLQIGDNGMEKIEAFASFTLTGVHRRWRATRKELYAVIFALQH